MVNIAERIDAITREIGEALEKMDTDKDGVITSSEVLEYFRNNVAREYIVLYIAIILGIVGYFKPTFNIESWSPIISIALISLNIIYGGYLKSNFQRQFTLQDRKYKELEQTYLANKSALNKLSALLHQKELEIDILKEQIMFWKEKIGKKEN